MTNFITGIIGIAGVLAFLGILLWWIKAVPLIIICVDRDGAPDLRLLPVAAVHQRQRREVAGHSGAPSGGEGSGVWGGGRWVRTG